MLSLMPPPSQHPTTHHALPPGLGTSPGHGPARAPLQVSRAAASCTFHSHPCRVWSERSPQDSAKCSFISLVLLAGRRFVCPWLLLRDGEKQPLPHPQQGCQAVMVGGRLLHTDQEFQEKHQLYYLPEKSSVTTKSSHDPRRGGVFLFPWTVGVYFPWGCSTAAPLLHSP